MCAKNKCRLSPREELVTCRNQKLGRHHDLRRVYKDHPHHQDQLCSSHLQHNTHNMSINKYAHQSYYTSVVRQLLLLHTDSICKVHCESNMDIKSMKRRQICQYVFHIKLICCRESENYSG